jgi:hypothetical protein
MDDENYRLYQGGEEYDYFGDLVKRSPYSIDAPAAGYWHLVIEPLVEGVPLTVAVQKIEG